jgi:Aminoglycoside-2''-adenylyltransferase
MGAQEQLAALTHIGELLDEAGLDYWLFGGWAVDFHLGAVTREHSDIDVAVWLRDVEAIASLLETHAWRHNPYPDEDGGTGYERDGVRVELTYLVSDDAGRVFIPLRERNALWSERAPENEVRELHGVRARVIPLGLLRAGKSSPREDQDDAAKDRADFEALSRLPD